MPLPQFTNIKQSNTWEPKFLPDMVVSFGGILENNRGKYDSDSIKLSEGFLSPYPIYIKSQSENYLDSYKTIKGI